MIANRDGSPLRILIVTEAFLPQVNGVTNSVLRLLEFCQRAGHEVLVIAPESENAPKEYLGFKIKYVPSIAMKKLIPMGLPKKYLEPFIEGFNPDVIHLASPIFLGHYVARLARKANIPTVSVYQTDIAGFARHYGLTVAHNSLKRWVARIHSTTDLTLAPSAWACRDLEKSGVTNVKLWQRGVDLVNFTTEKANQSLKNSFLQHRGAKHVVGYVGRLANEKRIDDLAIIDSQPDIQLVIVGHGPAEARLKRELPNAIFVGYKAGHELAEHVATFDTFVHTGKHETFCQAIQESLASGTVVVGPDSGGPTDLIEHGKTGLLIDTADSHLLLHSIYTLLEHPSRDLMQIAARKSVQHRTWEYINERLIEHYRDVIELIASRKDLVA
jgi:phosphatidylinositol alpha 1,6-mannosyltransferase